MSVSSVLGDPGAMAEYFTVRPLAIADVHHHRGVLRLDRSLRGVMRRVVLVMGSWGRRIRYGSRGREGGSMELAAVVPENMTPS